SAVLAALSVLNGAGEAAIPHTLAQTTIRFGLLVAAGQSAAGVIPSHIAALAAGVTRAMFFSKAKIAIAALFVACLFTAGAGMGALRGLAANAEASAPAAKTTSQSSDEADPAKTASKDAISFSGRVLDPDGKPVADAKLYVLYTSVFDIPR